ncbi:RagB/SusD family nutrient uptake outer membrane protein [Flammeovirga sp. OC4]|uniref:RagB/SusD family nutrient uptake outer membrane protein n=1 Tax=Flammeovirga sp. OC4 TaxID=1382345 RepID=UPI0009E40FC3|nr:RagB/SusD family nutrient uptake outer membrane protein [Flammeovirga sp. OC4]
MKKIYLIFLLLMGCDYLDIQPNDRIPSSQYYNSVDEAYQALLGAYEPIRTMKMNYVDPFPLFSIALFSECMSDNVNGGANKKQTNNPYQEANQFEMSPIRSEAFWRRSYNGISRVNSLFHNWENITIKQGEEARANNILGEAYFLRAHYYFELLRMYENVILTTEPIDGTSWRSFKQEDPEKVYAQATDDYLKSFELMAETDPERGRMSMYASKAELLKMFLFYTGYYEKEALPRTDGSTFTLDNAIALADDIYLNSGKRLLPKYADNFDPLTSNWNDEVLLEIPHVDSGLPGWTGIKSGNIMCRASGPWGGKGKAFDATYADGWANGVPRRKLLSIWDDPNDERKMATILTAEEVEEGQNEDGFDPENAQFPIKIGWQHTGLYNKKYSTFASIQPSIAINLNYGMNHHAIRFADVILMAGELYLRKGNTGKALEYVNLVRTRANAAALAAIDEETLFAERNRELALEGVRYHDLLRRYGQSRLATVKTILDVKNYTPESNEIDRYGEAGKSEDYEIDFKVEQRGFLPIPIVELDVHPELQQNNGY